MVNRNLNQMLAKLRFISLFVFFSLIISLSFSKSTFAQTTIWSEDFPEGNNTTIDPQGRWTLNPSNNNDFSIRNNELRARGDMDGVWISENIDISAYNNISLSANIRAEGSMENDDYMQLEYNIDGSGWNTIETNGYIENNFGSAIAIHNNLLGNSLALRIRMVNSANNEYYYADNIIVQGISNSPPDCTIQVSPANGETDVAVDATIDWNAATGATGYYIYFGTDAGATNIENGTDLGNVTSFAPSANLDFLTTYYWRVVPYNSFGIASGCSVWSFATGDVSYCVSNGTIQYDDGIAQVSFGTINNLTNKPDGYNDYTTISTDLDINSTYNLTVNINTDGYYTNYSAAWIDWNNDGDFEDTGEEYDLGFVTYNANGVTSSSPLSITVPSYATVGTTRMRISTKYANYPIACETNFDGEVEDYSIIINPSCSIVAQNVIGGGSYCEGGTGIEIGLDGSEIGVDYQLFRDGTTPIGSAISGNGGALSFGFHIEAGTYTIVGHNVSEDCDLLMTGNAVVSVSPEPTLSGAAQDATICSGTAATINLSGLVPNTTFSLEYSIDGVTQSQIAGLTVDGSGNSSFLTPELDENDDGKTLQITVITITDSSPSCTKSFSQNVSLSVQPTGIDVSISASPSGAICSGTIVTYTAIPANGGANPSYQWKVNGTNVGTNSDSYSYVPSAGDVVSCVMVSDAACASGSSSVPVTYFSWGDNSKTILEADYGLNATSGSGLIITGGIAGSTALAPIPDPTRTDINLTFSNNAELNVEGIDFSVSYQPGENSADLLNRGSSLTITGGGNFGVTYTVVDELGTPTTQSSGGISNPSSDYPGFHEYRFTYNPLDGFGRLYIDGSEEWISLATPGQTMDWSGAGDLVIGNAMDASGSGIPTLDNLSIAEILQNAATDSLTVSFGDSPSVSAISSLATLCAGETINPAVPTVSDNGTAVTDEGWQLGGDVITMPYAVSDADDGKLLQYYATNSCGTDYSNQISIVVNPLPTATTSTDNGQVCEGEEVIFTITGTSGATVTYNINGSANQSKILSGGTTEINIDNATEAQTLKLVSVSDGTCVQDLTETKSVTVNPLPATGEIIPD